MNERVRQLRTALKMSQEDFGKWLGISKSGVSDIESGRRNVTEQHIIMLKNHNVNEHWLRNGIGEMFVQLSRDEQIEDFIGNILRDESTSFKRRLISVLANLTEEEWEILEAKAKEIVGNEKGD